MPIRAFIPANPNRNVRFLKRETMSIDKDGTFNVPPKYLDFNSLKELPESHAWAPSPCVNIESPVPVIDLDDEKALQLMGDACKKWGIFQVVNHNIKKSVLDNMEAAVKDLFSLPMEQKLKTQQPKPGMAGYGLPVVSYSYPNLPWIEGFTIVGSQLEFARTLWPNHYQTYCDVIEEYDREMKSLANRLKWLMLASLGITKNDAELGRPKGDLEGCATAIQLNAYPPCPDPDRAMGLAAHTDSCMLTILHQNISGLEVHLEGLGWISAPLIPGSLTVNVGDLFHILTNGLLTSALHRVAVNRNNYRVSMAYFYGPTPSVKISPLPKLVDQSHPQLYNPVTWTEYRDLRSKYHPRSTLSNIRICNPGNEDADGNGNLNNVQDEQ